MLVCLNVVEYEKDVVTCLDGETCGGETWVMGPCVAGTKETGAPCHGVTGE